MEALPYFKGVSVGEESIIETEMLISISGSGVFMQMLRQILREGEK